MSEHLTQVESEEFSRHQIKGAERVRLLLHLEDCQDCRAQLSAPTVPQILERLYLIEEKSLASVEENGF